ncbi:hypothetical protein OG900_09705 [Streptomyces sp. NBC_00433]
MAHRSLQAFQQHGIGRCLTVGELMQAPEVIGDIGLLAGQVPVCFRQSGQIRREQSVGVVALQLPAGVAGQRVDTVVQRGGSR